MKSRALRLLRDRRSLAIGKCRYAHYDSTGQVLTCNSAAVEALSHTIQNLITLNDASASLVAKALEADPYNPMVMITALIEARRNGGVQDVNAAEILARLNTLAESKKLPSREHFLSAALLASEEQNHFLAGALCETALRYNPKDVLSMRMAQQAYIAAGTPEYSLSCAVRYCDTSATTPGMLPIMRGIAATGYLECMRLKDAEECANSAIGAHRIYDIDAVQTLMGVYHFTGATSEAIGAMDEYQSWKRKGELFWKAPAALANISRGNCYAAFKAAKAMLTKPDGSLAMVPLAAASVWQVILHLTDRHIMPLDSMAESLDTTGLSEHDRLLVHTIRLATHVVALETNNMAVLVDYRRDFEEREGNRSRASKGLAAIFHRVPEPLSPVAVAALEQHNEKKEALIEQARAALSSWLGGLDKEVHPEVLENVQALRLTPSLPFRYNPEIASAMASRNRKQTLQACRAIGYFALGEYEQVCSLLAEGYGSGYQGLGWRAPQRDVLANTFIEAVIRTSNWKAAREILAERVVLYPNSGQMWRKLHCVYLELGMHAAAKDAEYTAWQQGIGQGGFGGPI